MENKKDPYSPPESDVSDSKKSGRKRSGSLKIVLFLFFAGFVLAFMLAFLFSPSSPVPITNMP